MNPQFKMNTLFVVSLSEIKKQVEEGQTDDAIQSLNRLWKYCAMVAKHEEVIDCSYLHIPEAVENAKKELRHILWSSEYPHKIEL